MKKKDAGTWLKCGELGSWNAEEDETFVHKQAMEANGVMGAKGVLNSRAIHVERPVGGDRMLVFVSGQAREECKGGTWDLGRAGKGTGGLE